MMEPIRPSVWRRARRNTALSVSPVKIAKGEYQGCPPAIVRGCARHPSIASSVNQTVKLPRWRKDASCTAEFVSLCFCSGIWWRAVLVQSERQGGYPESDQGGSLLRQAGCGRQWALCRYRHNGHNAACRIMPHVQCMRRD